jgi:hypothetical protein
MLMPLRFWNFSDDPLAVRYSARRDQQVAVAMLLFEDDSTTGRPQFEPIWLVGEVSISVISKTCSEIG